MRRTAHGFHVAGAGLGQPARVTRLGGAGCGDGVLGVALAASAATLTVRSVDLDHGHLFGVEVAGQPGPVGPGALDADQLDLAEVTEPGEELAVAGGGGVERLDAQQVASL